ncbi:hypothetical protein HK405_007468 [Cladochytrium tenue]|nr:hypothetical protein HK405_007468 [Cladochytrium tenue]
MAGHTTASVAPPAMDRQASSRRLRPGVVPTAQATAPTLPTSSPAAGSMILEACLLPLPSASSAPSSVITRLDKVARAGAADSPAQAASALLAAATRHVAVPAAASLLQLHVVLQVVFGLPSRAAPHCFKTARPAVDLLHGAADALSPPTSATASPFSPPPSSRRTAAPTAGSAATALAHQRNRHHHHTAGAAGERVEGCPACMLLAADPAGGSTASPAAARRRFATTTRSTTLPRGGTVISDLDLPFLDDHHGRGCPSPTTTSTTTTTMTGGTSLGLRASSLCNASPSSSASSVSSSAFSAASLPIVMSPIGASTESPRSRKRRISAIEAAPVPEDLVTFGIVEPEPDLFLAPYASGCYILHSNPFELPRFATRMDDKDEDPYAFSVFENLRDERIYQLQDVFSAEFPSMTYESDSFESNVKFRIRLRVCMLAIPGPTTFLDGLDFLYVTHTSSSAQLLKVNHAEALEVPTCVHAVHHVRASVTGRVSIAAGPGADSSTLSRTLSAGLRDAFSAGGPRRCHLCAFHGCRCGGGGSGSASSAAADRSRATTAALPTPACCPHCWLIPRGTLHSNLTPAVLEAAAAAAAASDAGPSPAPSPPPFRAAVSRPAAFMPFAAAMDDDDDDDDDDDAGAGGGATGFFRRGTGARSNPSGLGGVGWGGATAAAAAASAAAVAAGRGVGAVSVVAPVQDDRSAAALFRAKADELRRVRREFLAGIGGRGGGGSAAMLADY